MPIYSYQCEKCGHLFDLLEGITAEKVARKCPDCGSKKVQKKCQVSAWDPLPVSVVRLELAHFNEHEV